MKNLLLEDTFPKYENNNVMLIGGWDDPINTIEDYQLAKDMGLNLMFIAQSYAKLGTPEYQNTLKICEKVGISAILTIGNCGDSECAKEVCEKDDTDYSQFTAVKAINYWDEPFYKSFDNLESYYKKHVEKYGDKIAFYANHFPNTAIGAFGGLSYAEFLSEYAERFLAKQPVQNRILSADIYPLETRKGVNIIRSNWLNCIETLSIQGSKVGALTHFFILNTAHHTGEDITYREVLEEDIRYQFWVNMAYGIKAFSYFTYNDSFCKSFSNSCVRNDISCSPHEQYYRAKKVNSEVHALEKVYLSFSWEGTMPIYGVNNKEKKNENFDGLNHSLVKIDILSKVTASEDTLIGQFKDEKGNNGLVVTNFSDPYYKRSDKVILQFEKARKARVFDKGQYKDYSIENNALELTLEPGNGVFIIVI